MGKVNRYRFKQLNNILWDVKAKYIEPKDVYELYERRWAYVDEAKLDNEERVLIDKLIAQEGHGVFMPAF